MKECLRSKGKVCVITKEVLSKRSKYREEIIMEPVAPSSEEERDIICDAVDLYGFGSIWYCNGVYMLMFLRSDVATKYGSEAVKYLKERVPNYNWSFMSNEEWVKRDPMPKTTSILSRFGWRGDIKE